LPCRLVAEAYSLTRESPAQTVSRRYCQQLAKQLYCVCFGDAGTLL